GRLRTIPDGWRVLTAIFRERFGRRGPQPEVSLPRQPSASEMARAAVHSLDALQAEEVEQMGL
ncbi:MAG: hypothetical protein LC748_03415, partial [Thermomicrobia bacterium]|nr:hypothetical protein [Thermomicrobia bacterium]